VPDAAHSHQPDHIMVNDERISVVDRQWPYPTREPYFPCCGVPVAGRVHLPACIHFREVAREAQCPACEMVGFHSAGCVQMTGTDPVSRPRHYLHPSGVETIRVNRCMTFCAGSAFKYMLRYEDKTNPPEDLKKARWYVADMIANDDPIWINVGCRNEGVPLLDTMLDRETNPHRARFFTAILDLDVESMAAAVDDAREALALAAQKAVDAPVSGHVWGGDES